MWSRLRPSQLQQIANVLQGEWFAGKPPAMSAENIACRRKKPATGKTGLPASGTPTNEQKKILRNAEARAPANPYQHYGSV